MSEIYQQEFLDFKGQLQSFLFRILTNKQDSEDLVQDTYITAFDKIETFKGNSSFKTWVFTIALNKAKNYLAKQNRWLENAQDYGAKLHIKSEDRWLKFAAVFNDTPEKNMKLKSIWYIALTVSTKP